MFWYILKRARENDTQIEVKEKQFCFVHNGYGYDVNFDTALQKTERGYELGKGVTNIHIGFWYIIIRKEMRTDYEIFREIY